MGGGAMLGRLSSAVRRLLSPRPEAPEQEPDQERGPGGDRARPGRKRPHRSSQRSEEKEDDRPWKRLKMGDLVEVVRGTALGAWETTGSLLGWLRGWRISPGTKATPPPTSRVPDRLKRGPPPALSPTEDLPSSLDNMLTCPSGQPAWTPLARPAHALLLPRVESLLGSGDGTGLTKRPLHSPRSLRTANGHSRSGLALPRHWSRHRAQLSAWGARRTPSPCPDPALPPLPILPLPQFVPMYSKTFNSSTLDPAVPRSPSHSPLKGCGPTGRKNFSTVEETIRQEEKEIYRQLLEMVTSDYTSKPLPFSVSSPLSHRELPRLLAAREEASPHAVSEEESLCDVEPQASAVVPCCLSWTDPCPSPSGAADIRASESPAPLDGPLTTDTMSTGSDTESVIVVKVKEAPRRESGRMPKFDAVLWIRELTSMYDSRARERQRLIEEQESLAERLRQQRLQEKETLSSRATSQLHLTVPLVEEVPIADIPRREFEQEVHVGVIEKEEDHLPELTEEMLEEVFRVFRPGNPDEVLSEAFRLTITRKDIHTLSHLNWLNDEVINFYMNLLAARSRTASLPSVHAFNTFFFPKVKSDGYQAVRRWTKKVDIFAMDVLLVPVHLGVHWCLAVVDFRRKTISYYDSMGGSNDTACRILLRYLTEESLDKRKVEFNISGWVLGSKRSQDIPQQMNGSDCGMFTCKYADYISRDRPIRFSQKDMPYFRQLMAWEILHQRLL